VDRNEWLAVLGSGRPGVQRWNRFRAGGRKGPSLAHVDFCNMNLDDVDFSSLNLAGSRFVRTSLVGASFRDADLGQVNFREANLQYASFVNAVVSGASFESALLFQADLRRTRLEGTTLNGAQADETVKWPEGFKPALAGVALW
jgi:uncharacterized protein YjbI with pentapeptide repeats